MAEISRRDALKAAAAAVAATQLSWALAAAPATAAPAAATTADPVKLTWLEGGTPAEAPGTTFGVAWPQGALPADQPFALTAGDGTSVPVQSWPTAHWPDGTLKWTAHAVGPGAGPAESYTVAPGTPARADTALTVDTKGGTIDVDTGVIQVSIAKAGAHDVIRGIRRGNARIASKAELVVLRQPEIDDDYDAGGSSARWERFTGRVGSVTVEQAGPVRAVIRIEGEHERGRRSWLPFVLRLYLYAGSEAIRVVHTITYDGAQQAGKSGGDFVKGLGLRIRVPLTDELYNRHIRLAGADDGFLTEAVQGITGLRRDPGTAVRTAQVKGERLPDIATWDTRVSSALQDVPAWGDYSLSQLSADGFTVRKRTKAGHGWIHTTGGTRSPGFGYVGGVSGGLSFGLRDFWQKHPAQLDIRGAASDEATVTLWLWSPEAQPLDLRFYHDGLGQDTYEEQTAGLNITYEDYEPGFATPYGIARTSELCLWANAATPTAGTLVAQKDALTAPPQLVAAPETLHRAGVFAGLWSPVDRSTTARKTVEDRLDLLFTYYQDQREQRRWYGFLDYGDVQHTYDPARHTWCYDVGGYAWDNSELSTDLWLWLAYLRSGRADIYRFAEAMTRHTGEVDVYHLGKWAGLGTRHGVQHFGDSAKQVRISTPVYRRLFYYLTADERTGDLMHAQVDADETFLRLDPNRKVRTDGYTPGNRHALSIGFGTDWSGLGWAWWTEWERRGPKWRTARKKLLASASTIAAQPNGFVQGSGLYDLDTGAFAVQTTPVIAVSHLSASFGLPELAAELIGALDESDIPGFRDAWLDYCRYFNATSAEQKARYGASFKVSLVQGHSRLDAYAASLTGEAALATRAWNKFRAGDGYPDASTPWATTRITGPTVLNAGTDAPWISTNSTALYGLAAIENLALVGDTLT
ncbi:Tat pathway signal sequence domain protein [Streptomyces sp. AK08-02]|uniref:exo-rhamnogalacturonan lyase family protein n=1 Tax=Streptomyces sp. AK08-02 TaxID=3028654 RepID=UPI0029A72CF5|nr:Tat pathway signal sequence domain protein [Streptomyces sp. AK08-02]MDX3745546.1 Tat pathway signal sequence domain protein [Streptomyces sp. AK08-02]